jgi:hypothetical protein
MVFCFGRLVPRFGVKPEPEGAFLTKALKEIGRERIGETEGQKVTGSLLLPVGKAVAGSGNILLLSQKTDSRPIGHAGSWRIHGPVASLDMGAEKMAGFPSGSRPQGVG